MSNSKQVAKNVIWKYLEMISVSGIQLLCTFIMAHFLTPADYGILGIVLVFSAFADVFIYSGFGQALVREKDVTRTDYSTILYFNIAVSLVLYVLLYFSSGLIASLYEQPILNDICKIAYLIMPIHALSLVQMTKLQKEIKFKKNFIISFISSLVSAVIAIYIAYLYRNVWALIIQVMMTSVIRCVLLWATSDFIPVLQFSKESFNKYFKFSKNLILSGFIGTLFNNIYPLIIGKAYSTAELGFYSQAKKINDLGSHTTTQVVQSVTYPILARINNEGGDIKMGYKKIISVTLIVVGFVMGMILSCAQNFFELCMGSPIWRTAGTYLLLIGISGVLYPLHAINQNILLVKGESKNILKLEVIRRSVMIIVLLVTINFDIEIFIFGLSFYSFVLLFLNLYYCGRPINYSVWQQLKDTTPIFTRLAIMILLGYSAAYLLPSLHIIARITLSCTVCLISGLLLFWKQQNFRELLKLVKSMIKK